MKSLLAACIVMLASADVRAEPSWWQQFYVQTGYRTSLGLERTGSPTLAIGYRHEHGRFALDVAAFDVQQGMDEGVHELGRVALVLRQPLWRGTGWISAGGGYSIARGWVDTELPQRRGHGVVLAAAAGYDLRLSSTFRAFGQVGVGLPLYDLRDQYESVDSATRIVPVDVAIGLRF